MSLHNKIHECEFSFIKSAVFIYAINNLHLGEEKNENDLEMTAIWKPALKK